METILSVVQVGLSFALIFLIDFVDLLQDTGAKRARGALDFGVLVALAASWQVALGVFCALWGQNIMRDVREMGI